MEIYIQGQQVDIATKDVSLHFASIRFADAIHDEYSTDIDIPMSRHNIALLGAWGMLDRSQMFGQRINCDIVIDGPQLPGYLQITQISDGYATATLYVTNVPEGMWDASILAGSTDDDSTIFRYDGSTDNNHNNDVCKLAYPNGGGPKSPNIRVNKILSNISSQYGVTLPTVSSDLALLVTGRKVCPQNKRLWMTGSAPSAHIQNNFSFGKIGQHICINSNDDGSIFTANRFCNISFYLAVRTYTTTAASVNLFAKIGGVETAIGSLTSGAIEGNYSYMTIVGRNFNNGDTVRAIVSSRGNVEVMMYMYVQNYIVSPDDYGEDINYIDEDVKFSAYGSIPEVTAASIFQINDVAYQYIGTYCNLEDISVRSLVNSICWHQGKRVSVSGSTVSFVNADVTKNIEADIVSMSPMCDRLGQKTMIAWNGGRDGVSLSLPNRYLEDEVTIHTSDFYGAGKNGLVPQYENGTFKDIEGIPLMLRYNVVGVFWRLGQPSQINSMGLNEITRVMIIEAKTYDNISDADYVIIDGHKYMIIEGDRDVETGLTEFTAILI